MKDFHYGVFVGRFQPFHNGHEHIIRQALEQVETMIIVIGSDRGPRTIINPFTTSERMDMIRRSFAHEIATNRVVLTAVGDEWLDEDWADMVSEAIGEAILKHANQGGPGLHGMNDFKIALAGYGKDESSFYLGLFPCWDNIQIETQHGTINATDIRNDYLRRLPRLPLDAVPEGVYLFLRDFKLTDEFKALVHEKEIYEHDKGIYGDGPFLTADVLVQWRGKILVVIRGNAPGKGLFAMPGGFVESDEKFLEAAQRELLEETGIKYEHIEPYMTGHMLADNPRRSMRGRVVSMVYSFSVPDHVDLTYAKAGDDAANLVWLGFDALRPDCFFDDHYFLINEMLS